MKIIAIIQIALMNEYLVSVRASTRAGYEADAWLNHFKQESDQIDSENIEVGGQKAIDKQSQEALNRRELNTIPVPLPTGKPIENSYGPVFPDFGPKTWFPSEAPTYAPVFEPTFSPTLSPHIEYTNEPTFSPTYSPTFGPTFVPTFVPTRGPTPVLGEDVEQEVHNTILPTASPSFLPTFSPSLSPTFSPSFSPTYSPTRAPIQEALGDQTGSETSYSKVPTTSPTWSPTYSPSFSPTYSPSFSPTVSPSNTEQRKLGEVDNLTIERKSNRKTQNVHLKGSIPVRRSLGLPYSLKKRRNLRSIKRSTTQRHIHNAGHMHEEPKQHLDNFLIRLNQKFKYGVSKLMKLN